MGLSLQVEHPFASQWRPNSLNADISQDMVPADLGLRMTLPLAALAKVERPAQRRPGLRRRARARSERGVVRAKVRLHVSDRDADRHPGRRYQASLRARTIADILEQVK